MFGVDDPRMEEAIALRLAVFVDEQGIPLDEEIDAHDRVDAAAVHAIVRNSQQNVIATGRFYPRDVQTAQIGRMAVARASRGVGARHLVLHAIGFYEKAGFISRGPTHLDCGIIHQPMSRPLGD